jgi:hypothetical protein
MLEGWIWRHLVNHLIMLDRIYPERFVCQSAKPKRVKSAFTMGVSLPVQPESDRTNSESELLFL